MLNIPTLLVLASGNKIFVLQNENLKKIIDIDTANLNIVEVTVQYIKITYLTHNLFFKDN